MIRTLRRVAVVAAVVALSAFSAQSAFAAGSRPLPANNTLYVIDDNNSIGTLNSVDVLTGTPTVIGNRGSASGYGDNSQGAYNPVNGKGYWVGFNNPAYDLVEVNLTTGAGTSKGRFSDGTNNLEIFSIAIGSDGRAFGLDQNYLYSINLTNARATKISANAIGGNLIAFAFNPANSTYYAIGSTGTNNAAIYTVNVADGTATSVLANSSFPAIEPNKKRVYAIAFDADGKLWGLNVSNKLFSATSVADFATSVELVGPVNPAAPFSLFIKYPIASNNSGGGSGSGSSSEPLANTGTDARVMLGLGAAGMAAIAGGVVFVTRSRRRSN
jgi:hypothetical protein